MRVHIHFQEVIETSIASNFLAESQALHTTAGSVFPNKLRTGSQRGSFFLGYLD